MTGTALMGIRGKMRLRIRGAYPEECLGDMAGQGIRFRRLQKADPLTVELTIARGDYETVCLVAKRHMCDLELIRQFGLWPQVEAMGWRMGYFLLLLGMVLLVFYLQGHIFFFEVQGNTTIPSERILRILEDEGIGFGTSTKSINVNELKNSVLAKIPELGFLTVNTEGPIATVVVRQREEKPVVKENLGPANVVAAKGGIVEEITVTGGCAQVKAGDVVTRGQVLISGVTNLEKTLLLTRGEGEVTARTFVRKQALIPDCIMKKRYTGREKRCFSLTFGKNMINFYKTSGISYDNYDKMSVRKTLTLPGGYEMPVSFTVISVREYELVPEALDAEAAEEKLQRAALEDTRRQLTAGMILDPRMQLSEEPGLYRLTGILECREEIGVSVEIEE